MGLESTMICVDNSEFMRNGDYTPNRLAAVQDAVNTICRFKLRSNAENNVGLVTLSNNAEVRATLTSDVGKVLSTLHKVEVGGTMNLLTGLRIAHLALKHRTGRSHRMTVVCFVGSPVADDEKAVLRVARKLKKESVNVQIVNFGEVEQNTALLELIVNTVNGKDSTGSHLVTVPAPCSQLSDALLTSAIMASEEGGPAAASFASGGSFEFGVDPNEDPELALALRVSMEEQRQRQSDAPAATDAPAPAAAAAAPAAAPGQTDEERMLQQALEMSLGGAEQSAPGPAPAPATPASAAPAPAAAAPDFANMTEEEQIAYAMQISMAECEPMEMEAASTEEPMEGTEEKKKDDEPSA